MFLVIFFSLLSFLIMMFDCVFIVQITGKCAFFACHRRRHFEHSQNRYFFCFGLTIKQRISNIFWLIFFFFSFMPIHILDLVASANKHSHIVHTTCLPFVLNILNSLRRVDIMMAFNIVDK